MATRLKGNMADLASLVEQLGKLTVIEAADLVKQLETAWGVTAAAPVAVAAAVVGVISLVVCGAVVKLRKVKPPLGEIVCGIVIGAIPLVAMLIGSLRQA